MVVADVLTTGERVRLCDYLAVAQIYLQRNFLLREKLQFEDVKPRLLGHWGTCHGINVAYAETRGLAGFEFILGPGHGFPALQANLWLDGELSRVDARARLDKAGLEYICRDFSWPGGFPSHSSPVTPGVIAEGGELGYALATGYGAVLARPKKTAVVLIGDGEFETGTALASMNLVKLIGGVRWGRECLGKEEGCAEDGRNDPERETRNGRVLPILHLNGYKISGPTIYGRKSERELLQLIRGFGFAPIVVEGDRPGAMREALDRIMDEEMVDPFVIMRTEKGAGGPSDLNGEKIAGNFLAHQVPLKQAKHDRIELQMLEEWLLGYEVLPILEKLEKAGGDYSVVVDFSGEDCIGVDMGKGVAGEGGRNTGGDGENESRMREGDGGVSNSRSDEDGGVRMGAGDGVIEPKGGGSE